MLKMRIIPCLDVNDGRVVKGVNFVDLRDAGDPVEVAARYDAEGADELAFLDITASSRRARHPAAMWSRVRAERCFMPLTVGGGVRTLDDVRGACSARRRQGVDQHRRGAESGSSSRAGSGAFGSQCIVVAIDAKRVRTRRSRPLGGVHPWRAQPTGHRRARLGDEAASAGRGRDPADLHGSRRHRAGFDLALTRAVADAVPVPVIASGGVGTLDHLVEGIRDGGAAAVLAASIFHFGDHTIGEAKRHMAAAGIAVQLD